MKSFHCVHYFSFCGDVQSVQDSIYGPYSVVVIMEVLRNFGFVVGLCKVANVFAKSDVKSRPVQQVVNFTLINQMCVRSDRKHYYKRRRFGGFMLGRIKRWMQPCEFLIARVMCTTVIRF
jgi:hypothetical protein